MYSRKYGRLTPGAWLSLEMEHSSPVLMLLSGALLFAACTGLRLLCGSPYPMIHAMGIEELLPPGWMLNALRAISCFLIGCGAGFAIAYRNPGSKEDKYKGCFLFVLLVILELLWYPTLFVWGLVFVSALERIMILCLNVGIVHCFYRVSKFAGVLFLLHALWQIYLLIVAFSILFH